MDSSDEVNLFKCPDGFTKEDLASQLYFEDLDKDSELWVVRIPDDIEPSLIENNEICFDTPTQVLSVTTGDDSSREFEIMTEKRELPTLCLVLPHKEYTDLSGVKQLFKGDIFITDHLMTYTDTAPEFKAEPTEQECSIVNGDDSFVKAKSKSHKKRHKNVTISSDADNSCFIDSQERGSSNSKKKHKSKSHKKKSHSDDEIEDLTATNMDDFPACVSQR